LFYDATGNPSPNGDFEYRDGKLQRRANKFLGPGDYLSFDIALMDAAPSGNRTFFRDGATTFTDAERQLAESPEGQMIVARARASHARKVRYLGDAAPQFTDAMKAAAIRAAIGDRQGTAATLDRCAASEPHAKAMLEDARRRRSQDVSTRYMQR
jgi:hypothetical protein